MTICLFLILMIINLARPNPLNNTISTKALLEKCQIDHSNCTSDDEPICLRLKQQKDPEKYIYMLVINRCEMKSLQCYQDMEAVTVPMATCENETHIDMELRSSRSKRETARDCPTECPSRDVMICARCWHGIYRTFLSPCHMRVFACQTNEKLQLVSRLPCAVSAPYLAELPDPTTSVTDPHDHDTVLRFLYCMMKGLPERKADGIFEEIASCVNVRSMRNTVKKHVELHSLQFRRAYSNPFHPEDDQMGPDFESDEDGDNLHGSRMDQLSDTEKKIVSGKRLKINGRYFDISKGVKNSAEGNVENE